MKERPRALLFLVVFLAARFIPWTSGRPAAGVSEAFSLLHEYARDHVLLCLVPALLIAGAISVFVSQGPFLRCLGPGAPGRVAYPVASAGGAVLAVCSCTILPLFSGIYRRGAGLGPAIAFLYAGPAINILAVILTARVLGPEIGIARALGAVTLSVLIGLLMHLAFRGDERRRAQAPMPALDLSPATRRPWQDGVTFAGLIGVLVFANWGRPMAGEGGVWWALFTWKWPITGFFLLGLVAAIPSWFGREELRAWMESTWGFARQILPLLFAGILVAGFLLGRPGHEAVIPSGWVARLVGGNGLFASLVAAIAGAFMYFATLTEVPILQGLIGSGMGKGPALALLLAGPALSLPSILVIRSVLGTRRTAVYVLLAVTLSTLAGFAYGLLFQGG